MTNFGKKIKEKGITLYKISKDTGVSWPTLRSWVTGKRKPQISGAFFNVCNYLETKHGITVTIKDFSL